MNVRCLARYQGFRMTVWYPGAPSVIHLSLPALMAGAWTVQRRSGNSRWGDTIRTFSVGRVVAAQSAERPAVAGRSLKRAGAAAVGFPYCSANGENRRRP